MRAIFLIRGPVAEPVFDDYPLDHRSLGISEALADAIDDWDARYKSSYDRDFSRLEHFSEAVDRAHLEEGRRLARALQEELGDGFVVDYRG